MPWELLFAGGIGSFFLLASDPPAEWKLYLTILIAVLLLASLYIRYIYNRQKIPQNFQEEVKFNQQSRIFLYIYYAMLLCVVFIAGFLRAQLQVDSINWKVIPEINEVIWVRGTIDSIEPMEFGSRMVLTDLNLWTKSEKTLPQEKTPEKIRLVVRTKIEDGVKSGSRIAVKAHITPPAGLPAYPGGYNFSRYAFLNNIGGVGYTVSEVKKFDCSNPDCSTNNFRNYFSYYQAVATEKIKNALKENSKSETQIVVAILAGFQNGIPKETINMMRISGLAHILSISGLHMALVMFGVYFVIRKLSSLSITISNQFNSKKLAALIAIPLGFAYLGMSGFQLPAVRSYFMVLMVFLAVITDRAGMAMHSLLLAALTILLISPDALLSPSFQMSFLSVIALIAGFDWLGKFAYMRNDSHNFWHAINKYIIGIVFSSIFAGIATGPIAAFQFGRVSSYGLAANILGVPLTSFIIMPAGMISLLAMPFGLEELPLKLTAYGVKYLIKIGQFVADWEGSQKLTPQIRFIPLAMFYSGFLVLCLFKGKVRSLSVPLLIFGFIGLINPIRPPDLIIGQGGELFAIKAEDNRFYFNSLMKGRFARKTWLEASGQAENLHIRDLPESLQWQYQCNKNNCNFSNNSGAVQIILNSGEGCDFKVVFDLSEYKEHKCNNVTYISREELKNNGTVAVWLKPLKIVTSRQVTGSRRWTQQDITH
jgi:competence protein ComEC